MDELSCPETDSGPRRLDLECEGSAHTVHAQSSALQAQIESSDPAGSASSNLSDMLRQTSSESSETVQYDC